MSRYTEWYYKNIEEVRARCRNKQTEKRNWAKKLVRDSKNIPCADCGISYPYWVMDFDHVRGEKKYDVNGLLRRWTKPLHVIVEEMEKCDVVCANCHRERTYWRGVWARGEEFVNNLPVLVYE